MAHENVEVDGNTGTQLSDLLEAFNQLPSHERNSVTLTSNGVLKLREPQDELPKRLPSFDVKDR